METTLQVIPGRLARAPRAGLQGFVDILNLEPSILPDKKAYSYVLAILDSYRFQNFMSRQSSDQLNLNYFQLKSSNVSVIRDMSFAVVITVVLYQFGTNQSTP